MLSDLRQIASTVRTYRQDRTNTRLIAILTEPRFNRSCSVCSFLKYHYVLRSVKLLLLGRRSSVSRKDAKAGCGRRGHRKVKSRGGTVAGDSPGPVPLPRRKRPRRRSHGHQHRGRAHQEQAAAEEGGNQRGEVSCFIIGHLCLQRSCGRRRTCMCVAARERLRERPKIDQRRRRPTSVGGEALRGGIA